MEITLPTLNQIIFEITDYSGEVTIETKALSITLDFEQDDFSDLIDLASAYPDVTQRYNQYQNIGEEVNLLYTSGVTEYSLTSKE